jgi:hypothetical protein
MKEVGEHTPHMGPMEYTQHFGIKSHFGKLCVDTT